jgi:hypothetical protein
LKDSEKALWDVIQAASAWLCWIARCEMALEKEVETYHRELPNLLANAGKYVLIHKESVISWWDSYTDALQEGYRLFGLEPFLVKQIQAVEPVHHVTRDLGPACLS